MYEILYNSRLLDGFFQSHFTPLQCLLLNPRSSLQVSELHVEKHTFADRDTQVGAGPAGLVLALDLLQHGMKVRIVEKTETTFIGQRGAGIMVQSFAKCLNIEILISCCGSRDLLKFLGPWVFYLK